MVKLCSKVRCTNVAKKGGVCMRHGAKHKQCDSDGCTNKSVNGGVCMSHAAKKECKLCGSEECKKMLPKEGEGVQVQGMGRR